MTREELEKEAGDYADKHAFRVPYDGSNKFYDDVDFKASKEGYLAGAEPREKRITELEKENAELKAQIEKMKCCENCKHHCFWGNELNCRTLSYDEELECMKTKSSWEEIKDENN